jgi:DNA-binding IclR family transcriptional regulator
MPSSNGTVQSIGRAFQILELLRSREQSLGVSEIAELSGFSMTTTHRLLKTLVACRAIQQDSRTRLYDLSPHMLMYGKAVLNRFNFLASVHPMLGELSKSVGETVFMGILDDRYDLVYIDQVDTLDHPLRMTPQIGLRQPAHCTALGKVLLSGLPSERLSSFMQRGSFDRMTDHTITTPAGLEEELRKVREAGCAFDREETETGICCVAAPVRDSRRTVAAISISGPATRMTTKGLEGYLSEQIRATAVQVSSFVQDMEMRG